MAGLRPGLHGRPLTIRQQLLSLPLPLLISAATVLAAGAAAVLLPRRRLALALFILVGATSVGEAIGYVGPVSLYLFALAGALAALLLALRTGEARPVRSPVFLAAAVFLATRGLSVVAAADPAVATSTVVDQAKDLVVLIVVATLLVSIANWRLPVAAAVAGLAVLAGLSLGQEFLFGNGTTFAGLSNVPLPSELPGLGARHSGPEADVNFWARTLVLFVPFALSLAAGRRGLRRASWLLAAGALGAGVYLTQSRGGLLALVAAVLIWSVLYVRNRVKVVLVAAALIGVAAIAVPGAGARLSTLASVAGSGPTADQSLIDRRAVQRVGWAMFRASPLLGVGAGNFTLAEPSYRRLAPELSQITAPHNVYLEMLAEGGVLGLAGWLLLYGVALVCAVRSLLLLRLLDARGPPSGATLLALAVVAALASWATASAVLHLADFPALLIVMGVGAALDVRARALAAEASRTRPDPASRLRLRALLPVGVGVAVVAVLAGAVLLVPRPVRWQQVADVVLVPSQPGSGAYVYDVLSRSSIVTTYAALFRDRGLLRQAVARAGVPGADDPRVDVRQTGGSAFTVTVSGRDRSAVRRLTPALISAVQQAVPGLSSLYAVRTVG